MVPNLVAVDTRRALMVVRTYVGATDHIDNFVAALLVVKRGPDLSVLVLYYIGGGLQIYS